MKERMNDRERKEVEKKEEESMSWDKVSICISKCVLDSLMMDFEKTDQPVFSPPNLFSLPP